MTRTCGQVLMGIAALPKGTETTNLSATDAFASVAEQEVSKFLEPVVPIE